MGQLPDFEDLVILAKQDPQAFESFRQSACRQFIATAPSDHQHRLAAVQNRVEMELRRAKTPLAGLLKISCMMHDSLYQLSSKWIEFNRVTQRPSGSISRQPAVHAAVISLSEWKARSQEQTRSLH